MTRSAHFMYLRYSILVLLANTWQFSVDKCRGLVTVSD